MLKFKRILVEEILCEDNYHCHKDCPLMKRLNYTYLNKERFVCNKFDEYGELKEKDGKIDRLQKCIDYFGKEE